MKHLRQRERLRREFGYRCGYCGLSEMVTSSLVSSALFSVDQYLPRALYPDRQNEDWNLVYSCRYCNQDKGVRDPLETAAKDLVPGSEEYWEHLRLEESGELTSQSEMGDGLVSLCNLNDPRKVALRRHERELSHLRERALTTSANLLAQWDTNATSTNREREGEELLDALRRVQDLIRLMPEPIDFIHSSRSPLDTAELEKELTPPLLAFLRKQPEGLDKIDPYVFEDLIGELFASLGFEVLHLGRNPKTGADILAVERDAKTGAEIRHLIEVKRHRNRIGVEEIHRVLGAFTAEKEKWGWDDAIVVSASGFTDIQSLTRTDLRRLNIQLRDQFDLDHFLLSYRPRLDGGLWLPCDWRTRGRRSGG